MKQPHYLNDVQHLVHEALPVVQSEYGMTKQITLITGIDNSYVSKILGELVLMGLVVKIRRGVFRLIEETI